MHLMYTALSARFGFKVSWRNAPPYRYKAFGVWCRRNGLDPATGTPLEGASFRHQPSHRGAAHRNVAHRNVAHRSPAHRSPAHSARSQAGR
jgi:hypothetical protein